MLKKLTPRLRFSLRALLVIVTIGSIALGIVVNRAERQRKAVAWVKEHYGSVRYAHVGPYGKSGEKAGTADELPAPRWLIDVLGEHYFFQPNWVGIHGVTPETDLSPLANLPGLKSVSLGGGHVTAAHLRQLSAIPSLTELSLSGRTLDADALQELRAAAQLKQLSLSELRLNAAATQGAFSLSQLRNLFINQCELDLSTTGACETLQNLEELGFRDITNSKLDFGQLGPLPKLRVIDLSAQWSPATYAAIAQQPALEYLVLEEGELTLATLDQVCENPSLKDLGICCDYSDEVADRIQSLRSRLNVVTVPLSKNKPQFNHDTGEWEDSQANTASP